MKKIIVVVAIVIAVVATAVVLQSKFGVKGPLRPPYCEYGDVDGDGKITLADAFYPFDDLTWDIKERGDVNNDGVFNSSDTTLIYFYYMGTISTFPIADPSNIAYQLDEPPAAEIAISNWYPKVGDTITISVFVNDSNGEILVVYPAVYLNETLVSAFREEVISPGSWYNVTYTFTSPGTYDINAGVTYRYRAADWIWYYGPSISVVGGGGEGQPYININYPHNGAMVSDTVKITGVWRNTSSILIEIRRGNTLVETGDATLYNDGTWEYYWATTKFQDGEYSILAKAMNPGWPTYTSSVNVYVNNGGGTAKIVANFTYVIDGKTVYFTDMSIVTGATTATYYWDFGDGTTSTEQNPTHTYAKAGTYFVTLTVTANGNSSSVTKTITIEGFNMWYIAGGGIALLAVGAIVWRWRGGKK